MGFPGGGLGVTFDGTGQIVVADDWVIVHTGLVGDYLGVHAVMLSSWGGKVLIRL